MRTDKRVEPSPRPRSTEPSGGTSDSVGEPLDVCLLSYRSNPYCGGQGVYLNYLSDALMDLGHSVTVLSGRPYPDLEPEVDLVKLPGENIVDKDDRLGAFKLEYARSPLKLFEWISTVTGGFSEPYTFGERAVSYLREMDREFDVVHDNQSLCHGLLEIEEMGTPVVATVHHPITVDRDAALERAEGLRERALVRRWYRFLKMQKTTAQQLPRLITVSEASKRRLLTDFDVEAEATKVVPNGIDTDRFAPVDDIDRDPSQIICTISADMPLKGMPYLLRVVAKVRHQHDVELAVVGEFNEDGRADRLIQDLDLADTITTYTDVPHERLVELYASSAIAVVPSLFEGFGLPAGEAMACGTPVVATRGGGLSEVVADAGVLVPPGDVDALAREIQTLLENSDRRRRVGIAGRERMTSEFCWEETARETAAAYRQAINNADY
jgi:glycosyltransferase involved in cell wall biosynthesis